MPELALRGRVMAKGGYTPDEIKKFDTLDLLFVHHYQEQQEQEFLNQLSVILGVKWDLDVVRLMNQKREGNTKEASNQVFIPLSVAINPKIIEHINSLAGSAPAGAKPYIGGGEYMPKANEKVLPMTDMPNMSKEAFKAMVGGGGPRKKA